MKTDFYRFSIFGGDLRQVYLARLLAGQGHTVTVYGLCRPAAAFPEPFTEADSFAGAAEASAVFICPTPFLRGEYLSAKSPGVSIRPEEFFEAGCGGKTLFGGCIPQRFRERFLQEGGELVDLMQDETVAVRNSLATAEGAVAKAVIHSPRTLRESRCLILGYGRCGSALAALLKGICRETTVCARSPLQRAKASVCADEALDMKNLYHALKYADIVFNTIPSLILNRHMLRHAAPGTLILDLASAPGGVDLFAAEELGVRALSCPGLPGKYAPETSAQILADAVAEHLVHSKRQKAGS